MGFAHRNGGRWYVVYERDGEIRLYAGGCVIQVGAGELRRHTVDGTHHEVRVYGADGETLRVAYRPARFRWWNRLDPTFDALDEETSDFFVWLERLWDDAGLREELQKRWASAAIAR
jgi:hypothetical protein